MQRSTVDSLLRISQAYCEQVCEKQTLDFGIVYSSVRFRGLPDCNQYREVIAEAPTQLQAAHEECEACFLQMGLTCFGWAPAQGRASAECVSFLASHGYVPRSFTAMTLAEWISGTPGGDVRVLPARAMREAYGATFALEATGATTASDRTARIESALERLDSSHLDMFVALHGGAPAGRCGLFQVGDLCEVIDPVVAPNFASRGVESALLGHVLALAKRLALRNVFARVLTENEADRRLLERHGFSADGVFTECVRTSAPAEPAQR